LKRSENIKNNKNEYPFLSVCICVYNSEKYIEKAILSIINQTYQNFEIIIINDFSNDNSYDIITELKMLDNRIKIINHINNLGIYHSRVEGVLNSRGKYIIFLDPDDLFLNPYLFELLFNCYKFYNLDIIEFTAYYQIEEKNKIYYSENELLNHEHNFEKIFIYQPELSNILFYKPRTKNYSMIICRTVWSKLYKKDIILKTINFIGIDYYENHNIIVAEDTLLNIISFHFANNYSNINIPGYLYNIRQFSITRLNQTREYIIKKCISFFLYYNCLYRYIKEFNKDRNYFYYELEVFGFEIIKLKKYNINKCSWNNKNYI
jgi:glycosyltransferase involved in cell wall biosynthesis